MPKPTGAALAAIVLAAELALGGCTFRPQIGMSFDDWNSECRSRNLSGGTLVERSGDRAVYYCGSRETLYTFDGGALANIKDQPAYGGTGQVRLGR